MVISGKRITLYSIYNLMYSYETTGGRGLVNRLRVQNYEKLYDIALRRFLVSNTRRQQQHCCRYTHTHRQIPIYYNM